MPVGHQIRTARRMLGTLEGGARPRRMMERDIIVLWGLYRGWPNKLTPKTTRVHPTTIIRRRKSSLLFKASEKDKSEWAMNAHNAHTRGEFAVQAAAERGDRVPMCSTRNIGA